MSDRGQMVQRLVNFRIGCEFVDYVGLRGVGFVSGGCSGGLRSLYCDVWDLPDACPAGGGECGPACYSHGAGTQELGIRPVGLRDARCRVHF